MPWLAGTALIHTLAVTERRGLFGNTTLLLAIAAFGLSLLGTFLVRSGVLVSVHAFASDPARGLFILVFLAVVMGGALLLYALRNAATNPQTGFRLVSRESALLVNTVLLSAATVLVLFGTPLIRWRWTQWTWARSRWARRTSTWFSSCPCCRCCWWWARACTLPGRRPIPPPGVAS